MLLKQRVGVQCFGATSGAPIGHVRLLKAAGLVFACILGPVCVMHAFTCGRTLEKRPQQFDSVQAVCGTLLPLCCIVFMSRIAALLADEGMLRGLGPGCQQV